MTNLYLLLWTAAILGSLVDGWVSSLEPVRANLRLLTRTTSWSLVVVAAVATGDEAGFSAAGAAISMGFFLAASFASRFGEAMHRRLSS